MVDHCKEPLTVCLFSCSSLVDSSAPLDSFLLHILRALRVSLLGMKSSLSSRIPSLEGLSLSLSLMMIIIIITNIYLSMQIQKEYRTQGDVYNEVIDCPAFDQ